MIVEDSFGVQITHIHHTVLSYALESKNKIKIFTFAFLDYEKD